MSDNNNLPQKRDSAELALHKTRSLMSITNKILANKTLVVSDDAWLDELIAWADENDIPDYYFNDEQECWCGFPRDKQAILNLTDLTGLGSPIELSEFIGKLIKLTGLNLYYQQLTELPEFISKLTNLIALNLGGNQLTELAESIGKLTNLTWLDLSGNQLTELPESIGNLTNLTRLNLGCNRLTELPESIGNLTNLTRLDLWGNPIKSLPPELSHLRHITHF